MHTTCEFRKVGREKYGNVESDRTSARYEMIKKKEKMMECIRTLFTTLDDRGIAVSELKSLFIEVIGENYWDDKLFGSSLTEIVDCIVDKNIAVKFVTDEKTILINEVFILWFTLNQKSQPHLDVDCWSSIQKIRGRRCLP